VELYDQSIATLVTTFWQLRLRSDIINQRAQQHQVEWKKVAAGRRIEWNAVKEGRG